MINPERRQAVLEQLCKAIGDGTNWSIATDCFCQSEKLGARWHYEFSQPFLDALCLSITAFTQEWTAKAFVDSQIDD